MARFSRLIGRNQKEVGGSWAKYRLFNVLCWLWNIYEGAELPIVLRSLYFHVIAPLSRRFKANIMVGLI